MTRSEAFKEWHALSEMADDDRTKAFAAWEDAVKARNRASDEHLATIRACADAQSPDTAWEAQAAAHGRHKAASEAADAAWDRYVRARDDGDAVVSEAYKVYEAATDSTT